MQWIYADKYKNKSYKKALFQNMQELNKFVQLINSIAVDIAVYK